MVRRLPSLLTMLAALLLVGGGQVVALADAARWHGAGGAHAAPASDASTLLEGGGCALDTFTQPNQLRAPAMPACVASALPVLALGPERAPATPARFLPYLQGQPRAPPVHA